MDIDQRNRTTLAGVAIAGLLCQLPPEEAAIAQKLARHILADIGTKDKSKPNPGRDAMTELRKQFTSDELIEELDARGLHGTWTEKPINPPKEAE